MSLSSPQPSSLRDSLSLYDNSGNLVVTFGYKRVAARAVRWPAIGTPAWATLRFPKDVDAVAVVTGTENDQSIVINTEENKRYVWFIKNGRTCRPGRRMRRDECMKSGNRNFLIFLTLLSLVLSIVFILSFFGLASSTKPGLSAATIVINGVIFLMLYRHILRKSGLGRK